MIEETQQRRRRRGGILELLNTLSYYYDDSILPHRWIRTVIERATRSHQRERDFQEFRQTEKEMVVVVVVVERVIPKEEKNM